MKPSILYHVPHLNTFYAGRSIYAGYKHAFLDLGYKFKFLTVEDSQEEILEEFSPGILITSLNPYNLKYLNLDLIRKYRKQGLKVFVNIPFWKSPFSKMRVNEAPSLSNNPGYLKLIKLGNYGDIYFNFCEDDDERMDGFKKYTGFKHYTIPLAADKFLHFPDYEKKFISDISFIGTALPGKLNFFKECVFPLNKKYDLKIYGQDWTKKDKMIGWMHKFGQYFNVPFLRLIQKPKLDLEDERKIYSSSIISINIHEDYQKKYGGDCNERTFKIPACGGFEITDNVACIRKYFMDNKEIVIAKDKDDWFDKINYYSKNEKKRKMIIEAGKKKVLEKHTYHNRVEQIIKIYQTIPKR